ncbi:MAG: hypothetical protein ACT4QG_07260 [Sporichthyaceae bacterium]
MTDGVAVAVFERKGGAWRHQICADHLDLAEVLAGVEPRPRAVEGGAPVAYAAGGYGDSRIVAFDAEGNTVAWDERPGTAIAVAACPGGRKVADEE